MHNLKGSLLIYTRVEELELLNSEFIVNFIL